MASQKPIIDVETEAVDVNLSARSQVAMTKTNAGLAQSAAESLRQRRAKQYLVEHYSQRVEDEQLQLLNPSRQVQQPGQSQQEGQGQSQQQVQQGQAQGPQTEVQSRGGGERHQRRNFYQYPQEVIQLREHVNVLTSILQNTRHQLHHTQTQLRIAQTKLQQQGDKEQKSVHEVSWRINKVNMEFDLIEAKKANKALTLENERLKRELGNLREEHEASKSAVLLWERHLQQRRLLIEQRERDLEEKEAKVKEQEKIVGAEKGEGGEEDERVVEKEAMEVQDKDEHSLNAAFIRTINDDSTEGEASDEEEQQRNAVVGFADDSINDVAAVSEGAGALDDENNDDNVDEFASGVYEFIEENKEEEKTKNGEEEEGAKNGEEEEKTKNGEEEEKTKTKNGEEEEKTKNGEEDEKKNGNGDIEDNSNNSSNNSNSSSNSNGVSRLDNSGEKRAGSCSERDIDSPKKKRRLENDVYTSVASVASQHPVAKFDAGKYVRCFSYNKEAIMNRRRYWDSLTDRAQLIREWKAASDLARSGTRKKNFPEHVFAGLQKNDPNLLKNKQKRKRKIHVWRILDAAYGMLCVRKRNEQEEGTWLTLEETMLLIYPTASKKGGEYKFMRMYSHLAEPGVLMLPEMDEEARRKTLEWGWWFPNRRLPLVKAIRDGNIFPCDPLATTSSQTTQKNQ